MAVKITIEAIVYTLIYSAFITILFKIQGAKHQLYNYPAAIRERAIEKGITTQKEQATNAKTNKVLGLAVMAVSSIIITCVVNRQYSFGAGFLQSYIFLNTFSFFDALVIDMVLSFKMVGNTGNGRHDRGLS